MWNESPNTCCLQGHKISCICFEVLYLSEYNKITSFSNLSSDLRFQVSFFSEFWHHVDSYIDTSVSEKHSVSSFRAKDGDSMFLQTVDTIWLCRYFSDMCCRIHLVYYIILDIIYNMYNIANFLVKKRCTIGTKYDGENFFLFNNFTGMINNTGHFSCISQNYLLKLEY